jgi:cell division protein FtsI/penicillin-binding protein 2
MNKLKLLNRWIILQQQRKLTARNRKNRLFNLQIMNQNKIHLSLSPRRSTKEKQRLRKYKLSINKRRNKKLKRSLMQKFKKSKISSSPYKIQSLLSLETAMDLGNSFKELTAKT